MVNKNDKPKPNSSAVSLAQVLAMAKPTNVDAALEEVAKAYNVIVEASDGMFFRFLEYGKIINIVARLKNALPAGSYSQYRIHIFDSEDKLVWEIEPNSHQSSEVYTISRYRRKPHWWHREPRARWKIVPIRDTVIALASLTKNGFTILGTNDVKITLDVSNNAPDGWNAMALTLVRGGLNDYDYEE